MNEQPTRFYRILTTAEPTLDHFRSNEELGIVPRRPLQGDAAEWWRGLSVFDTLPLAVAHRGRSAWLGEYIAVMDMDGEAAVSAQRTTVTPGHWTIWGDAEVLLGTVAAIIDITSTEV